MYTTCIHLLAAVWRTTRGANTPHGRPTPAVHDGSTPIPKLSALLLQRTKDYLSQETWRFTRRREYVSAQIRLRTCDRMLFSHGEPWPKPPGQARTCAT